jgi:hypothetical protein
MHADPLEILLTYSPLCDTSYYLTLLYKPLQRWRRLANQMIEVMSLAAAD